ncbi:HNH endonuclease [Rhizobium leguminosarum]|uniref:HNH endonuclease n=1 Tax=Rhizobium leguminosarum TaxID=384 RepID=UPI0012BC4881|nr:HNH endonuclease [Rhizobium leguminosarum]WFT91115.1 HNH endonuclease [Rhizobium leguminosarum]
MQVTEIDLETRETRPRIPAPGKCIYCYEVYPDNELTEEHVIPYALAANAMILEKSCCKTCQREITKYEQAVLKHQLGVFRAQTDAPTRNKKDRPKEVDIHFVEVDENMEVTGDLGTRAIPIMAAPTMINLWQSPPPAILQETFSRPSEPWAWSDKAAVDALCKKVAEETGAKHGIAMSIGKVNRQHYLRSLAKMAHAYAAAEVGVDAFTPFLCDIILNKADDLETYVGDMPGIGPFVFDPDHTLQISLGEADGGDAGSYLVVRIQLYPSLRSPEHVVVVGRPTRNLDPNAQSAEQGA